MPLLDLEGRLRRVRLDRYLMALTLTVVLAALFPARGDIAALVSQLT